MERKYFWIEHNDSLAIMLSSLAVTRYESTEGWVIVQYDEDGEGHRLGRTFFQTKELAMRFVEEELTNGAIHLPLIRRAPPLDYSVLVTSYCVALLISVAIAMFVESQFALAVSSVFTTMLMNTAAFTDPPIDQDLDDDL